MGVGVGVVILYDEAVGVFELRLNPEERLEIDLPFKSTGNDTIYIRSVDLRRSVRYAKNVIRVSYASAHTFRI